MREFQAEKVILRWVLACIVVISSLGFWYVLFFESLGYPFRIQEYGFPIAFKRVYHPSVSLFFPKALVFDLILAALVFIGSGYSFWAWSASWSIRLCAVLVLMAIVVSGLYVCLRLNLVPQQLGMPLFVLLLFVPITWMVSMAHAARACGRQLLGEQRAFLLPLCLAMILPAIGWWCRPHDILHGTRHRTDIPVLTEHLTHHNPRVRSLALSALRGLGPFNEQTASRIIRAMRDPDEEVQSNAISLAPELGSYAVDAVPILRDHFFEDGGCTFELAKLGPLAKNAVPALLERLPNSDGYDKLGISEALWQIDGNTTLVVPALIELLHHDFGPIRRDAAAMLGEIGPAAKEAVPPLQAMVDFEPEPVPIPLTVITSSNSIPAPRDMTEAEFYPQIRGAAETALRKILR